MRFQQQSRFKRWRRRIQYWGMLCLTLGFLLGFSSPAQSQITPLIANPTAPVVVNGRKVLDVQGVANFTAAQRAQIINRALQQEVKFPKATEIDVVEEDSGLTLKSKHSGATLLTVTEVDRSTPNYPLRAQARDWANLLEPALQNGQWELQPDYFRQALLFGLVALVGAIAIHLLLQIFGRRSSRFLNRWFTTPGNPLILWERPIKFFWRLGIAGIKAGLWLTLFIYITGLFPQLRIWRHTIYTLLITESITLGNQEYSPRNLLLLLGFTISLWFAARLIAQLFRVYILQRARVDPRLQDLLATFIQYGLLFLGIIILLQAFGINASSLTILASLFGVGIGFGVQNITNNFISGFIITVERPIQVGDFIKVGDLVGIVKQVGARSTEINTLDKVTIIVPNSRFLESEVINWSHGNPVSRLRVPVSVAYGSDIALVKTALLEAVKKHPEVLLRPEPEIWFQSFGDSALNFEIMVWTGDPRKQFRVKSDLNYAIEASLRHHDIEVPFVQQDVHLQSPQLDEIITLLKQQGVFAPSRMSKSCQSEAAIIEEPDEALEAPTEQTTEQVSELPDLLANLDVEALAEAMRGDHGVELQVLQEHPDAPPVYFTGTAAVDWLRSKRHYTHKGALLVGKWLLQKGLIYALEDDRDFEDSQALYQFYQDSPVALAKSVESPSSPVVADENDTEIYSPEAD